MRELDEFYWALAGWSGETDEWKRRKRGRRLILYWWFCLGSKWSTNE